MNSIIAVTFTTIFFIAAGWNISSLASGIGKIEKVGLSFLLGGSFSTFIWFLIYLAGGQLNLLTIVLSGMILSIIGFLVSNKQIGSQDSKIDIKAGIYERKLSILIISMLSLAFIIGSYSPLTAWDSLAQYDFRGHAIAIDHNLDFIDAGAYYLSYPLMISMAHAIVYMLGGISAQGLHAIILASFIAIVYGRMKDWTNHKYALLTCFLIVSQNQVFDHATFAYTNLPYTSYLVAGILYAVSINRYSLIMAGLLIGSSTWVRSSEIFWVVGLFIITWQGVRTKQLSKVAISVLVIISMRLLWSKYVERIFTLINFESGSSAASHITIDIFAKIFPKLQIIYWYLYLNIISPYLGIWILTIPSLIIFVMKKNIRLLMLISSIVISAMLVVGGVMVFSTYYPTWNEIGDSARRMMLFVIPLALITGVYSLYLSNHKSNEKI